MQKPFDDDELQSIFHFVTKVDDDDDGALCVVRVGLHIHSCIESAWCIGGMVKIDACLLLLLR